MPNYYNPYNFFPQTYPGLASMQPAQPNVYNPPTQPPVAQMTQPKYWEWVEGEVGAKAYQMPPGWPANQPIPLWDSTDTAIFIKSWNAMGVPNQILRIPYASQDNWTPLGVSGSTAPNAQYVTKDDIASLREEIQTLRDSFNSFNAKRNQNGSNNQNGSAGNVGKGGNNNG